MNEIQILKNLPILPYQNVWDILQKQAEEEEKRKKKEAERRAHLKPEPLPPAIKIDSKIELDIKPQPIVSLKVPTPEEFAERAQSIQQPTIAQVERRAQIKPQSKKQEEKEVLFASPPIFFDFYEIPVPSTSQTDKTKVKPPTDIPKENRILAVLRGEPDPIWGHEQYQKQLALVDEFNQLRERQLRQEYDQPTGVSWLDEQPEADLEKIKRGVSAGELLIKPGEIGKVAYYKKDPETNVVSKDYIEIPLSYFVYGLLPRKIGDTEYRVPTLKPLYMVDRDGKVYKTTEGILKETIKTMGTSVFGTETWDKMLGADKYKQPDGTQTTLPYLPQNFFDAIVGLSANIPFSNRVLMEPGGEPTEYKPSQPIYQKTQPHQELINRNPYTWAGYGLGNILAPIMDLPTLAGQTVPQFPATMPQVGEEVSKEEIERFNKKLESDELWSTVYNTLTMLPAGFSRVLTGTLALSYMAQPLTTSKSRPIESRVAESILNGALFLALAKTGKASQYIRAGRPVPVKVIAKDIAKRTGIMLGGEAFRHTFFIPYHKEEDAWQMIKPYVYTIGIGFMFEIFGLGHIIKHNRYIKKQVPPEVYKQWKEFGENYKEPTRDDIHQIINEAKKNVDNPEEAKAVDVLEQALMDSYSIADDIRQKLKNKEIDIDEANKHIDKELQKVFDESVETAATKLSESEAQEPIGATGDQAVQESLKLLPPRVIITPPPSVIKPETPKLLPPRVIITPPPSEPRKPKSEIPQLQAGREYKKLPPKPPGQRVVFDPLLPSIELSTLAKIRNLTPEDIRFLLNHPPLYPDQAQSFENLVRGTARHPHPPELDLPKPKVMKYQPTTPSLERISNMAFRASREPLYSPSQSRLERRSLKNLLRLLEFVSQPPVRPELIPAPPPSERGIPEKEVQTASDIQPSPTRFGTTRREAEVLPERPPEPIFEELVDVGLSTTPTPSPSRVEAQKEGAEVLPRQIPEPTVEGFREETLESSPTLPAQRTAKDIPSAVFSETPPIEPQPKPKQKGKGSKIIMLSPNKGKIQDEIAKQKAKEQKRLEEAEKRKAREEAKQKEAEERKAREAAKRKEAEERKAQEEAKKREAAERKAREVAKRKEAEEQKAQEEAKKREAAERKDKEKVLEPKTTKTTKKAKDKEEYVVEEDLPPPDSVIEINKKILNHDVASVETRGKDWMVVLTDGRRIPLDKLSNKAAQAITNEIARRMAEQREIGIPTTEEESAPKTKTKPAQDLDEFEDFTEVSVDDLLQKDVGSTKYLEGYEGVKPTKPAEPPKEVAKAKAAEEPKQPPKSRGKSEGVKSTSVPATKTETPTTIPLKESQTKATKAKKEITKEKTAKFQEEPVKTSKTKTTQKSEEGTQKPAKQKTELTAKDIQLKYDPNLNDVVAILPDGTVKNFFDLPEKITNKLEKEYVKVYQRATRGGGELYSSIIPGLPQVVEAVTRAKRGKEAAKKLAEGKKKAAQKEIEEVEEEGIEFTAPEKEKIDWAAFDLSPGEYLSILFDRIKEVKIKEEPNAFASEEAIKEFEKNIKSIHKKALKYLEKGEFGLARDALVETFGRKYADEIDDVLKTISPKVAKEAAPEGAVTGAPKITTTTQAPNTRRFVKQSVEKLADVIKRNIPEEKREDIKSIATIILDAGFENRNYDKMFESLKDYLKQDVRDIIQPIVDKYEAKLAGVPESAGRPRKTEPRPITKEELEVWRSLRAIDKDLPQYHLLRYYENVTEPIKRYTNPRVKDLPYETKQQLGIKEGQTQAYQRERLNNLYDDEVLSVMNRYLDALLADTKLRELDKTKKKLEYVMLALNPKTKENVAMDRLINAVRELSIAKFKNYLMSLMGANPREEFADVVIEALNHYSDKHGKLTYEIVRHEVADRIKHKTQINRNLLKMTQSEEKVVNELWDILKKQKPILGSSKLYGLDKRVWAKVGELQRLYLDAIDELTTKGTSSLPDEIFVRARQLMYAGYKNPYYIMQKLYEEFPYYPGHFKPTIGWIERQIKLYYAHRPRKAIPWDDFASFSSGLDTISQEYINQWRPSEVLYNLFSKELTPKERYHYEHFLYTAIPDVLRHPDKPLIFDYLRGTIKDKDLLNFTTYVKNDLRLHKNKFAEAIYDFMEQKEANWQTERLKQIFKKYDNAPDLVSDLFSEIYRNIWYKPIKQFGEKVLKQYENFNPLLAKLNQEFPMLIEGYVQIHDLISYHENKYSQHLKASKHIDEAFEEKSIAVKNSLEQYSYLKEAIKELENTKAKLEQYKQRVKPKKTILDMLGSSVAKYERLVKTRKKDFYDSINNLKELQASLFKLLESTKKTKQTGGDDSDYSLILISPSKAMAEIYAKLPSIIKGQSKFTPDDIAAALRTELDNVEKAISLFEANKTAQDHKNLVNYYSQVRDKYFGFLQQIAKEFQADPTGGFLWSEEKLNYYKNLYEKTIPPATRALLADNLARKSLQGKYVYGKLEGFEQFKELLNEGNIKLGKLDTESIKEAIQEELILNDNLRRIFIEKLIDTGYDAERIYLKLKTISKGIKKEQLWDDFAYITDKISAELRAAQEQQEATKTQWDIFKQANNIEDKIESVDDIARIFKIIKDVAESDATITETPIEDSMLTHLDAFGDDLITDIILKGGYLEKGFKAFYKDFNGTITKDKTWAKVFDKAGYDKEYFKGLYDELKTLKEKISEPTQDLDVEKSTLQINPLAILWTSAVVANYILPEEYDDLKRILLYAAMATSGGYLGYRAYMNYKRFGQLKTPPLTDGELNHRIVSAQPYIKAVEKFGADDPIVKKLLQKLKEIHKHAEQFTGAPLAIQSKNNPLAREVYNNIKTLERLVNTNHKNLNDRTQLFLKETPDDILGVISAATIQTQRDLYDLRRQIKQNKIPKLSKSEFAAKRDEFLRKNIARYIYEMKITKKPGQSFKDLVDDIFNKAMEYRSILKQATEIHYRNQAAKILKIPVNRQQEEYEKAVVAYDALKKQLKEMIEKVKAKRKEAKEWSKLLLKKISFISPESYAILTNALLSNPRINKILKENPDLTPEDLALHPQFRKSFEYAKKRLKETKEMRKQVALMLKSLELMMRRYYELQLRLKDYKQIYQEETKYLKQIISILNPDKIQSYVDKSENVIFWNPLWNRTFGDYGVKIESYQHKNGEPIAPMSEWDAQTKVVIYGLKEEVPRQKALEYLAKNGYARHKQYSDIWVKYDQNGNIQDLVRIVFFNKKELDVTKRHIPKFVEDLRTYYGALGKAYTKVAKEEALSQEETEFIRGLQDKIKDFMRQHKIDPAELEEGDLGESFNELYKFAHSKAYTKTSLGMLLKVLQASHSTVPMMRYRDFIGYETSADPTKEASLFKYALLNHLDKLREQGLQFNIYSYLSNNVAGFILNNNLVTTRFASYIQNLQNDLLYTPTNMYEGGLIKVGEKVFDARRLLDNVSSLAFFNVFFGNISAAYRNLKYNTLATTINQISEGKPYNEVVKDFVISTPNAIKDFLSYIHTKTKEPAKVPIISKDPIKQKTFEILYKGGVFTQSVLDALSTSAAGIELKDWFNLPTHKTDWLKLLAFKTGFLLQRNSEVLNKLVDFETRYEFLRRRGIDDPQKLASEIAIGLGRDVGFYQLHDLGEATRHLSRTPGLNLFLHMMKPAIIQNYNYLETLRVPYVYLKEKLAKKQNLTYNQQQAINHLKALGALSILTTLIAGWRGFPLLGDLFDFLDKSSKEIDPSNPKFDVKGLQKVKYDLQKLCTRHLGMSNETFEKYWLSMMYGVDSYLLGRNTSINNLLGPFFQPFVLDFYQRQMMDLAKELGKGEVPVDFFLPAGVERLKDYLKTISSGNVLIKSKFFDYETGRELRLKDYLFGYLGNLLEDTEIKRLEGKGYYEFLTPTGRKTFYKKTLAKIFTGQYKTQNVQRILNYLSLTDKDFKKAPDIYLLALDIYKNKYLDYVVTAKAKVEELFNEKAEAGSKLIRKLKDIDAEYGNAESADDYIGLIMSDIANYYQVLALNDAYRIILGFKGNFEEQSDFVYGLKDVSIENKGYQYAIRRRLMSPKTRQFLEELQEFFFNPINPETDIYDNEYPEKE